MSYWSKDYDKQSYKDSKRRRRQALRAQQTGRIVPIGRRKKRLIAISLISATVLLLAILLCVFVINKSTENQGQSQEQLSQSEELLRIVNKQKPLDSDYVPELVDFHGVKVNTIMLDSLKAMTDDAKAQGIELNVDSAYIPYDEQDKLYTATLNELLANPEYTRVRAEAAAQKLVPQAGCSESQTGLLISFMLSDERTTAYIERNCVQYGFILRYPEDKEDITHLSYNKTLYRYVGKENSVKMRSYNMCLEEYADYVAYE